MMKTVESDIQAFPPEHFTPYLVQHLPADLPHRERLISVASNHLARVSAANEYMNLTRIISPAEAAIKHIFDCVYPWRLFLGADRVLDAGTGAGFPGVPLSVLHPETRWILAESTGKKARFVDTVTDELALANVTVLPERAEAVALTAKPSIITARAVAPLVKLVDLFRKPILNGARVVLYKGPDLDAELEAARDPAIAADVVFRYSLPENHGSRAIVELRKRSRR